MMFGLTTYRDNQRLTYNPFREMEELEKRFFGQALDGFRSAALADFRTDVRDTGDAYLLEADLPGFEKDAIKLDVNGDTLTITAERHSDHEDKDKKGAYVSCERSYGKYERSFDVSSVDAEGIRAKYVNGVLTLTLPKKQEVLPASRCIEIE